MGDSASGGCGSREQTLLEAAKLMLDLSLPFGEYRWDNLRAAIAREEAKPTTSAEQEYWLTKTDAARRAQAAMVDRAQQAESTAAWHKAESERLSAELAKAKSGIGVDGFRAYLDDVRNELECAPDETTSHAAKAMRQRAEKAEAELAAINAADNPTGGGDLHVMLNRDGVKASERGEWMGVKDRVRWLIGDWNRAMADADRWKARADEAETAVASHCGALPKFEGDPKACAFPHGAFSNAVPSHALNPFSSGAAAADALIAAVGTFRALAMAADAVAKALGGKP